MLGRRIYGVRDFGFQAFLRCRDYEFRLLNRGSFAFLGVSRALGLHGVVGVLCFQVFNV